MISRLKRIGNLFLTGVLLTGVLTGCSDQLSPKTIFSQMNESLSEVTSFANDVTIDVKLESVVHITESCLELQMQSTTDPEAGYVKGNALIRLDKTKLESPMEIYHVHEDGKKVTYSSLDNVWTKEVSSEDVSSSGISISQDFLRNMKNICEEFHLAEETVELYGKDCYEMYGQITGSDLKKLVGEEMLYGYGLIEIPDEKSLDELLIPITVDIYTEDLLPARIFVDMTDEMNELYDEFDGAMNVNDFTIDLKFLDYNEIGLITVPEEVKQAAM